MAIIDWLERRGYVANYPGQWILLSGRTTKTEPDPSSPELKYHGARKEHAIDIIQRMWAKTPEVWTIAIKVPIKPRTNADSDQ